MQKGLWKIASKSVSGAADCAYSLSFLSHIFFSSVSTSIRNLCCNKPTKLAREKCFVGELQTLIHWSDIGCWSELVCSLSLCCITSISIALSETHGAETQKTHFNFEYFYMYMKIYISPLKILHLNFK